MHLTIFEKEIDAPGDVWETKSMHQGCLGNRRRCRDQKSMQLPSYVGIDFVNSVRCIDVISQTSPGGDRIGHPHVGVSRPPQPHCGASGGPAACLVGHQSDMVSLRLVQVCFKVYSGLFQVYLGLVLGLVQGFSRFPHGSF